MNDINEPCGDNLGGINSIQFIPVEDVISIPDPYGNKIIKPVVLGTGKRLFNAYATRGTIRYTQNPRITAAGTIYDKKLVASIPKEYAENEELYFQMRNRQFIVVYRNNNNIRKILSTLSEPLKFTADLDTGADVPNKNAHSITFFGEGSKPALFYNV